MWVRLDVYNKQNEFLGSLPDEPVVIGEYEKYPLRIRPAASFRTSDIRLQVGSEWLSKDGADFLLGSGQQDRGRRGQIPIRVFKGNQYLVLYEVSVANNQFTELHYQYLTRDLKRLLVSLSASDTTHVVGTEYDLEDQFVHFFDQQLKDIAQFIKRLKDYIYTIEQAPQRTIKKEYYLQNERKLGKTDAHTIRWRITKGERVFGLSETFANKEDYNVYENQFIIYVCDRLTHFLFRLPSNFKHNLQQKISEVNRQIEDWEHYGVIEDGEGADERKLFKEKQLKKLRQVQVKLKSIRGDKLPNYQKTASGLLGQLKEVRQLSFLDGVTLSREFIPKPTLVLLRDPAYNMVYETYRVLQDTLRLNQLELIDKLLGRVHRERTSKLYEYWVVLQVYTELRRMGFEDTLDSAGIWGILEKDTFQLKSGGSLPLVGRSDLYKYGEKIVQACIHYEYRFGPTGNFFPDIFITFTLGSTRILILDAKYRDYHVLQGVYEDDVNHTAIHKYKKLERYSKIDNQWTKVDGVDDIRKKIHASFIIHSHDDADKKYIDYGSTGQANEYGAIPLVPQETTSNITLKRLLRMFLRMHLHIFDVCWSESHSRPVKVEHTKRSNPRAKSWEGRYHCPQCDNSWWVNHCGHWCQGDENNVPKITFSDPADNFFEFDDDKKTMGDKILLKCSHCNKSYYRGW